MQITLRVTPETYQALKVTAAAEGRSLNRQIEQAIKEHLETRRRREQGAAPRG